MVAIIKPYREIEFNNQTKFAGHVHIKKVDRSGRVTFETKYKNLLTDNFLQRGLIDGYGGGNSESRYVLLGTGVQTEPQPNDTAMNNYLIGKPIGIRVDASDNSLVVLGATPADDYLSMAGAATFNYGEANGALTEIGLAHSLPTHTQHILLAKSLIKDSNGNPVVVNKTDAEQLIVRYEIRAYRPNEAESTFNIGGTDITAKILSYTRASGLATNIDTNQTGRGVYVNNVNNIGDSLCSLFGLTAGTLKMAMLWASSPSEGHLRINPTTAAREINSVEKIMSGIRSSTPVVGSVNAGGVIYNLRDSLVFINPTTRARETMTLPANYRMDIGVSFERGRK